MTSKTKKKIFFLLFVAVIAAVATGYYLYNKGPLDVASTKGTRVEAVELYALYSTDSISANKKFTGKVLEVSGFVKEVSFNIKQQKIILIRSGADGACINCTLEGEAGVVKENQQIIIKGIATGIGQGDADLGLLGDVYLVRCYIEHTNK